ncbi:helix-turn-helix transcriptional regulator [Salmonella enterica]|nr:helix-turn-helix transcriptional regulator [Salmonella enterica]EIL4067163.1 helix-turn-helix transcriptional regulator [Salmonella enterica]
MRPYNQYEKAEDMAADKECAERIRLSIIQNFTYDDIENETGISVSTLKRLASGEREPKLIEIRQIAKATGKNPVWLAFGESTLSSPEGVSEDMTAFGYGVDFKLQGHAAGEAAAKTRLMAAIRDIDKDDVVFLEKFIDLLNLDRTINSVKTKRYNYTTEEETLKMLNLPQPKGKK